MITLISQPTRTAARATIKNLVSSGKVAKLVDNGKDLKGSARWSIALELSNVTANCKPSKKNTSFVNVGFDIRKVPTSSNGGFDLYYDGEFLLRRATRNECYQLGMHIGVKNQLNMVTLKKK